MRGPGTVAAVAAAACCAGLLAGAGSAAARVPAGGRLPAPGHASASGGVWGKAREIPGLGALNTGGSASVVSVSCASAGNCGAGGFYAGKSGAQGFVVSERHGVWGKALTVRRPGSVRPGGNVVRSVSCPSAGNCAAGGSYTDTSGHIQGFVVSERSGVWGRALEVPGLGAVNAGGSAGVSSVSCGSAGNCVAGGAFKEESGFRQGFVVRERNGVWGKARLVPGLGALNAGGNAAVSSVSCPSAGNCAAGGYYAASLAGNGSLQGFVVSERDGVCGTALPVPGLAALNAHGDAAVTSVSCSSAGNCGAGGHYADGTPALQGFVVGERNGVWGQALEVPGLGGLNGGFNASVVSVSCPSAGNCGAAGWFDDAARHAQGFVVSQAGGTWHDAVAVTSTVAAQVSSVSCPSAGTCDAGGSDATSLSHSHGIVVSERGGSWGKAVTIPGLAALGPRGSQVTSVSCPSAGKCAAVGTYLGPSGTQGFVVDQT